MEKKLAIMRDIRFGMIDNEAKPCLTFTAKLSISSSVDMMIRQDDISNFLEGYGFISDINDLEGRACLVTITDDKLVKNPEPCDI